MGICLNDLTKDLPFSSDLIRKYLKSTNSGKKNISKDFLPMGSTDVNIRHPNNSRSRKCAVVWLDMIPPELKDVIIKGILSE